GKSARNLKTNAAPANVIQCGDARIETPDDLINFIGLESDWFCIRRGFDYRSRKGYILRKSVFVVRE
ncbi:MAG: hypothetical protein L0Y76_04380, partial [Ignavibacteria bacterium]|nr:hypothetical protein [Ignavibacteria bacterium]